MSNSMIELSQDAAPVFVTKLVTPIDASLILRSNTRNRNIRESHVATLARDMANGRWRLNGEAIKIAKNGDVLDGQHRLLALVASGKSVWLTIASNLDEDTQATMDGNLRRGNGDHFRLLGETNSFALAAILRAAWQWENANRVISNHNKPTQGELSDFLRDHPEVRRSVEIADHVYQGFRFFTKTASGVAHYIIMTGTDNDPHIPEFFARVGDGADIGVGNPIHTLRKRMMSDAASRVKHPLPEQAQYLIYTWNRWLDYIGPNQKPLYRFGYEGREGVQLPNRPTVQAKIDLLIEGTSTEES